jgi:DNA-binding GntR family transcriptional regulator
MGVLGHIIDTANRRQGESTEGTAAHERANRKGLAAHHRVVDLIEARDGLAAEQLWRKHLTEARDYLVGANVKTSALSAKPFGAD